MNESSLRSQLLSLPHRRGRLFLVAALTAAVVLQLLQVFAPAPARASYFQSAGYYGMFDRYTYGGAVYNVKAFYLLDRTGNALMHDALRQYADSWNGDIQRRGLYGYLPAIGYARDDAFVGKCSNGTNSLPQVTGREYSFVLACAGEPIGSMGVAFGSSSFMRHVRGNHAFPAAYCSATRGLDQRQMLSCFAHEIGHLIGLGHNDAQGNLMNTNSSGVTGRAWYTDEDFNLLKSLYPAPAID